MPCLPQTGSQGLTLRSPALRRDPVSRSVDEQEVEVGVDGEQEEAEGGGNGGHTLEEIGHTYILP